MTDPDGGVTTYTHDALNRLISLTDPTGGVTTFTYDALGRRTSITYPNGTKAIYTYSNCCGELLSLVNQKSNGEIISSYEYTHDNVSNRVSMKEANGDITTYEYDKLYRLTKVVYPDGRTVTYTYDPVGNRLSMNGNGNIINYTYDAANRLLQAGNVTFAYDNNGNTISKTDASGITNYQYDYENKLIGITYPNGLTNSFAYSPDGRRIKKVDSSGTTYYLLDRENVLQELNNEGTPKAHYVTTLTIDDLISRIAEGSIVYYHKDGLGSVTGLTDAEQNLAAIYKYNAFGAVTVQTGTVVNPYKFTSREFDSDSGLYYYRLRYYHSQVGRFITKDPLSFSIRMLPIRNFNPYFYVYNNPINYVDPLGAVGIGGGPSFGLCFPINGVIGIGGSVSYAYTCCKKDECEMKCGHLVTVCLGVCTVGGSAPSRGGGGGAISPSPGVGIGISSCTEVSGGFQLCASCSITVISCQLCIDIPTLRPVFGCSVGYFGKGFGCFGGGCYTFAKL